MMYEYTLVPQRGRDTGNRLSTEYRHSTLGTRCRRGVESAITQQVIDIHTSTPTTTSTDTVKTLHQVRQWAAVSVQCNNDRILPNGDISDEEIWRRLDVSTITGGHD